MLDVSGRLTWPNPHASDSHAFAQGEFKRITQISTDAFAAYPGAVDFDPYAK